LSRVTVFISPAFVDFRVEFQSALTRANQYYGQIVLENPSRASCVNNVALDGDTSLGTDFSHTRASIQFATILDNLDWHGYVDLAVAFISRQHRTTNVGIGIAVAIVVQTVTELLSSRVDQVV
jgi:hypothetical protein